MRYTLDNFYKSDAWEKLRAILIDERTNPQNGLVYCEHCGKPIVKAYDIIGHHKIELTDANVNDRNISLNPENISLIHHRCHNKIHKRFGFGRPVQKRVYIVYGPPLSGKTSWVRDAAGPDDLILDIDRIWQAISINEPYVKPEAQRACVFAIRDRIYELVADRKGKWANAYILGGFENARDREELAIKLNAELVPIIEPMSVCLDRLAECHDGRAELGWERHIRKWFDVAGIDPTLSGTATDTNAGGLLPAT